MLPSASDKILAWQVLSASSSSAYMLKTESVPRHRHLSCSQHRANPQQQLVQVPSASGKVQHSASTHKMDLPSASGEIRLQASTHKMDLPSASGEIHLQACTSQHLFRVLSASSTTLGFHSILFHSDWNGHLRSRPTCYLGRRNRLSEGRLRFCAGVS